MRKAQYLLVALLLAVVACEKSDDPAPVNTDNPPASTEVKFSTAVKPIFDAKCVACHGNTQQTAGYNLQGYANVSKHVADAALLGALKHQQGYTPMPKGGSQLPADQIKLIEDWITQGAKDN